MTTGPLVGPASAYPTLRTPASICLSGAKDVFVPGLTAGTSAGLVMFDCAAAELIIPNWAAATVMAAVPAAAEVARTLRLVGNEDSEAIIILLGASESAGDPRSQCPLSF